MDILLIGAPGAGKGTQAEKLSQHFKLLHVSSGDLFRKALEEQSEMALKSQEYLALGKLVPDNITIPMVIRRIAEFEGIQGVILDGFPRTLTQAKILDIELQSMHKRLDLAIYLKVSQDDLLQRLTGKLMCQANQHVYHVRFRPPKIANTCDLDGSKLYQRPDDIEEVVRRRLDIFSDQTLQLLDYYRRQANLKVVDGNQSIDQVYAMLLDEINNYIGREMNM